MKIENLNVVEDLNAEERASVRGGIKYCAQGVHFKEVTIASAVEPSPIELFLPGAADRAQL